MQYVLQSAVHRSMSSCSIGDAINRPSAFFLSSDWANTASVFRAPYMCGNKPGLPLRAASIFTGDLTLSISMKSNSMSFRARKCLLAVSNVWSGNVQWINPTSSSVESMVDWTYCPVFCEPFQSSSVEIATIVFIALLYQKRLPEKSFVFDTRGVSISFRFWVSW